MPSHATRTGMFGPQDDTPWLVGPRDRRASLGVKLHQTPRPTCPSPPMTVHARVLEGVAKPARKTRLLGEQSHLVASPRPESRIIPRSASSSSRTALALVDAPDPQGRRATHLSMRFARLSNKHDLDVWSSTTPRNQDDIETLLHRLRVAASTRTPRHEPAAHGHEEEEAARLLVSSMRSRSLPEHIRSPAPRNVFKVHLRLRSPLRASPDLSESLSTFKAPEHFPASKTGVEDMASETGVGPCEDSLPNVKWDSVIESSCIMPPAPK